MHPHRIITIVIAALQMALPAAAAADPLSLYINTVSYHTESWARRQLNQSNPGIGLEARIAPNWRAMAGFYLWGSG